MIRRPFLRSVRALRYALLLGLVAQGCTAAQGRSAMHLAAPVIRSLCALAPMLPASGAEITPDGRVTPAEAQ